MNVCTKKQIERGYGDNRLDEDFARAEPVQQLAAVEHQLQRADRDAQSAKAEPIELRAGVVRRLRQKDDDADEVENADRQVDVEHVAPAVILGQPAAEHRTQHRSDHHADAEQRHGEALALPRIAREQNRLRERNQRSAERALHDPEQHDLVERLRHAAQHRRDSEAGDRHQEKTLEPEPAGEKSGRRRHDGGGDDIRRQHPGDLVLTRRDAALHVRQRDVGDRRIERLHQRRQNDADGQRRAIAARTR